MIVKKGDNVMIITGDKENKSKTGTIIKVDPASNRVVVEGLNMVSKCIKPRSAQEKGGIVKQNSSIDASNVMLVCATCGKATKIRYSVIKDDAGKDKKVRMCKKCGAQVDVTTIKAKATAKKAAKKTTKKAADSEAK